MTGDEPGPGAGQLIVPSIVGDLAPELSIEMAGESARRYGVALVVLLLLLLLPGMGPTSSPRPSRPRTDESSLLLAAEKYWFKFGRTSSNSMS